ncbi:Neural cell adhesion molecule 1 [Liparis tanakae]|uniref:Neural cell adhesion molecule 1 n=1 Tax=Liparis tanakae TaxID=230148 RepID=A0A4Z2F2W4_9TELE|nr:Neural cell adhesion molecule 1 [Liparis tanakae]
MAGRIPAWPSAPLATHPETSRYTPSPVRPPTCRSHLDRPRCSSPSSRCPSAEERPSAASSCSGGGGRRRRGRRPRCRLQVLSPSPRCSPTRCTRCAWRPRMQWEWDSSPTRTPLAPWAYVSEPDRPVLLTNEMTVEGNSFSVPLQQADDGGAALLHFDLRYKQDEEGTEWTEMELPPNAESVSLKDLSFGSDYRLEVVSINPNGSSIPAVFNFTIADQPVRPSRLSNGSVVGIVMVVFLVVFLAVDAACCYRNRCGLLMSIAVKVFGHKVPGLRRLEQGEGTNGEVKLKSISTPRGSVQLSEAGEQKLSKDGGPVPEVTCDKAPLTQHQYEEPGGQRAARWQRVRPERRGRRTKRKENEEEGERRGTRTKRKENEEERERRGTRTKRKGGDNKRTYVTTLGQQNLRPS